MSGSDNYFVRILLSIDQFFNTITGGSEDETISSRMGKALEGKKDCLFCVVVCKMLHWVDPNHCKDAIEEDEGLN